jgi:AcrR family transcriptional regulator
MKKIRVRENPVIRHARIVDEGIRIIGERGYNGFTVQGLAERCGLSNAGLLHYFESKDALLLSLLDELERREMDGVAVLLGQSLEMLESGHAPGPIVFTLLREIIKRVTQAPETNRFITVLLAEALDPAHPAHQWFKTIEDETRTLFSRLSGYLVNDPEVRASELFAMMCGLQLRWYRADCGFDLVAVWEVAICRILPLGDVTQLHAATAGAGVKVA